MASSLPFSVSNRLPAVELDRRPLPLLSFPGELLLMIASNLSAADMGRLVRSNRYLHRLLTPTLYSAGSRLRDPATGKTPLHWAVENDQLGVARLLLERGADRTVQTFLHLDSPLHLAVKRGHLDLARCLFDDRLRELPDLDGRAPVHVAACLGRDHILRFMLDRWPEAISCAILNAMTPLLYAAHSGRASTVSLLLARGARLTPSDDGCTPLHHALDSGHEAVVRVLLEHDRPTGELVKAFCGGGNPVLAYAFCCREPPSLSLLQLLLDHGADVNSRSLVNGQSAVFHAASASDPAFLKLFLDNGARVTDRDRFGVTPLHEAAAFQPATVNLLLDSGAPIDPKDDEGQTPLYWAAERGQEDVVRLLLACGADINAVDACGVSPLARACSQCSVHVNLGMARLLVGRGADVNRCDAEGMTALHHAAREGHAEIVVLLLRNGARPYDRDAGGDSPLDLAEAHAKPHIACLLRQPFAQSVKTRG